MCARGRERKSERVGERPMGSRGRPASMAESGEQRQVQREVETFGPCRRVVVQTGRTPHTSSGRPATTLPTVPFHHASGALRAASTRANALVAAGPPPALRLGDGGGRRLLRRTSMECWPRPRARPRAGGRSDAEAKRASKGDHATIFSEIARGEERGVRLRAGEGGGG